MNKEQGDEELALYVISIAAQLSGLHPQTLRQYDRMGLVSPSRAQGRGRRYSLRDIALLRNVSRMVGEGINLAGIKRIIELESAMSNMAIEVAKLRIEVDALLESNPEKALVARRRSEVIVYNSQKSL
ncbi:MAG: transcriptional regulator [Actinobacteria bacterium BACL2 MAG-121001-bin67]|jgi:MerR family transcriptional regulator, heat shock protein HspR|uniref:Transcriptional regulator n=2 Tax=ac1 cluster TaxID=1655545 RepID=A0A0R2P1J7_9ACTN|nr:MAG: transcriptional regulator [Actinobacteria bacterium BACL2 MAG-120802-bin41]KRO30656.1 MAG: transcriptional regulator [Actinobacteria bacterium BACL2 MAG-121001-bin67]